MGETCLISPGFIQFREKVKCIEMSQNFIHPPTICSDNPSCSHLYLRATKSHKSTWWTRLRTGRKQEDACMLRENMQSPHRKALCKCRKTNPVKMWPWINSWPSNVWWTDWAQRDYFENCRFLLVDLEYFIHDTLHLL